MTLHTDLLLVTLSRVSRYLLSTELKSLLSQVFREGDIVLVCDDEAEVREKQRGHGEWTDTLR